MEWGRYRQRLFQIVALGGRVLGDHEQARGERNDKRTGGGFEVVDGVAVVGAADVEADLRAGARVVAVVNGVEAERLGYLVKESAGVAGQIELLSSGFGFEGRDFVQGTRGRHFPFGQAVEDVFGREVG